MRRIGGDTRRAVALNEDDVASLRDAHICFRVDEPELQCRIRIENTKEGPDVDRDRLRRLVHVDFTGRSRRRSRAVGIEDADLEVRVIRGHVSARDSKSKGTGPRTTDTAARTFERAECSRAADTRTVGFTRERNTTRTTAE